MSKKPAGRLGDLPRAAQVNPCPPQHPSPAVPRAAEDHPLPLCCGPARSRLKWRQPPCHSKAGISASPSKAGTSASPCPAVQGLRGDRAAGGSLGAAEGACVSCREPAPLWPGVLWPPLEPAECQGLPTPHGPSPAGVFAAGTDRLHVGDPHSLLRGKFSQTQCGGSPPSPRRAREGLSRRDGQSSS